VRNEIDSDDVEYAGLRFSSRQEVASVLAQRILSFLPERAGARLLDLGCGTGAVAIAAARARPDVRVVAIDISAENCAVARTAAGTAGLGHMLSVVCADYMSWSGAQFDLIVSDGVLQLVPCPDESLASRIARDLVPGGVLVATLPVASIGNAFKLLLRRIWRVLPQAADRLALWTGQRLYPTFPPEALAERIPYLRSIPERLFGAKLVAAFERHGLDLVADERWENPSAAKLDHHLTVWRRR